MMTDSAQTVLIVDDVEGVRRELRFLLEDEGYVTISASNGHEALSLLARRDVNLVLTDILMPEMDGVELISAIKQMRPKLPIVAITGGGGLALRGARLDLLEIAQRLGASRALRKPFRYEALMDAVNGALAASA